MNASYVVTGTFIVVLAVMIGAAISFVELSKSDRQ
jgi:hypothetical protein